VIAPIRISSMDFNRVGDGTDVMVNVAFGWCMDAGCGLRMLVAWMKNLRPAEEGSKGTYGKR
jgi:hypothetical protein